MNRVALGLAVGAGYLLGRTKKAKFALAVGSMVAGKKLNLGPRGIADLVNQQLMNNPQFKEIGDQLRRELRGVGKAASGALVERQMTALADRLHERTAQVRDELAGVVPQPDEPDEGEREEETEGEREEETEGEREEETEGEREEETEGEDGYEDREGREAEEETGGEAGNQGAPARKEAARKAPAKEGPTKRAPTRQTAKKASADAPAGKEAARKAPAKKAPAKKAAATKAAAGRTAAKKTAAPGGATRAARSRRPKGGGDR